MKHTALPWKLDRGYIYAANERGMVAGMTARIPASEEVANAEYIVRACNSHEELLAGLKDVMAMIDAGLLVRDITKDSQPEWTMEMMRFVMRLQNANLALTHAEGNHEE